MSDTGNLAPPPSPATGEATAMAALEAAKSPDPDTIKNRFTFDGENADLWPMTLRIAILNLITLFTYRFWGRTTVRRYLWSHTSFLGDRFSYTGTGKEMLLGFLIVFCLILLPIFLATYYVLFFMSGGAQMIIIIGFPVLSYFLFYVATYRALRYRLSRTNWRGIRGTQTGSAVVYALKAFGWFILLIFTAGLFYPLQSVSLTATRLNNAWFGDRKFSFESTGRSGLLYRPYMRAWLGYIFKPVLIMAPFNLLVLGITNEAAKTGQTVDQDMLTALTTIGAALVYLGVLRSYARYKARELAIMAPWLSYGDLRFTFESDHNKMFRLIFGNTLITFLTLGFGRPFAQKRTFKFMAEHITVLGEPDFDTLGQSKVKGPGMGEGLADAFDAGAI